MRFSSIYALLTLAIFCFSSCTNSPEPEKPNVIFIMADDQGYGDIGAHGNPYIQTPNINKLHDESVSFLNFHVGTTCAPSRGGLLTGQYGNKVGVWHTINGRQILAEGVTTMADIYKSNGYTTSIFGKWHLGDNYPFRPQDRGFDEVLVHGGGGVGQQPDYWNNDYFDDTYFRNGTPEKFEGYCTDVWFSEAKDFISKSKDKPFFCYVALNAPHGPFNVPSKYSDLYADNDNVPNPEFYGMITNIDENLGSLRSFLDSLEIAENTILVYMTDNGTAAGVRFDAEGNETQGFNAGMRGTKSSNYEGGHRVPFFMHWPKGQINVQKSIGQLVSYIDFMPTLMDLCGIKNTSDAVDGISLRPLLNDEPLSDRVLIVDTQREEFLVKGKRPSVMTNQWRMTGDDELYDIKDDKGQRINVASEYPEVMERLKNEYEFWWAKTSVLKDTYCYAKVGSELAPEVTLFSHDLHMEKGMPAWNQVQLRAGSGDNGFWPIEVVKAGNYEIELARWPKESGLGINEGAPAGDEIPQGIYYKEGLSLDIRFAQISIGEQTQEIKVNEGDRNAKVVMHLDAGKYNVNSKFTLEDGSEKSVYYAYLKSI